MAHQGPSLDYYFPPLQSSKGIRTKSNFISDSESQRFLKQGIHAIFCKKYRIVLEIPLLMYVFNPFQLLITANVMDKYYWWNNWLSSENHVFREVYLRPSWMKKTHPVFCLFQFYLASSFHLEIYSIMYLDIADYIFHVSGKKIFQNLSIQWKVLKWSFYWSVNYAAWWG